MSDKLWEGIKHFSAAEFDSPDVPGSGDLMNIEFVKLLDQLRDRVGFPLHITSGYRTPAHNATLGKAVDGSAHTQGVACDIAISTSGERFAVVFWALEIGIKRVGMARTFVHLDMDFGKPQRVLWLYD